MMTPTELMTDVDYYLLAGDKITTVPSSIIIDIIKPSSKGEIHHPHFEISHKKRLITFKNSQEEVTCRITLKQ